MTAPRQIPLFDSDPAGEPSPILVLARSKPQSKAEATFQRLIARIEEQRAALQNWQAFMLRHEQRLASELLPLEARMHACKRQMITVIDALLSRPTAGRGLGRVQRVKLERMLLGLLDDVIDDDGDDALIALFDKYSGVSFAEAREADMEVAQSLIEDLLGVDLGREHRAGNPAELMEHARRKLHESVLADQQRRQARKARPAASRKAEAAQARKEQAEKEIRQSIRDVYRKLASALHPDREPDADERRRKTLLIQRVNQAYDAGDLLTLLGLQLEIEQIDAEHLTYLAPERLAHYNRILRDQLDELDAEIEYYESPFREMIGIRSRSIDPQLVDQCLSTDIAGLRASIEQADADLAALQDPKRLAALLKGVSLRAGKEIDDDLDASALIDVMAMLDATEPGPGKRRRRR